MGWLLKQLAGLAPMPRRSLGELGNIRSGMAQLAVGVRFCVLGRRTGRFRSGSIARGSHHSALPVPFSSNLAITLVVVARSLRLCQATLN